MRKISSLVSKSLFLGAECFAFFTNSENHFRINYYFPATQLVLLFRADSNGQLKQISVAFSFKNLRELLFFTLILKDNYRRYND
jgi:hypothetical protein